MAEAHSFESYIEQQYYDVMADAISSYIEEHKYGLELRLRHVINISEVEVAGIGIVTVFVHNRQKLHIDFDVVARAELYVRGQNHRRDDEDECEQWFLLSCSGDLEKNLDDFEIKGISVYNKRTKASQPLSKSLVQYIKSNQFEDVANDFLKRYYPEALEQPIPLDPSILAKRMGLKIKIREISKDASVFGELCFYDTETDLYDATAEIVKKESIAGGTILVDPRNFLLRNLGSVNNTIVHECVHWDKHRIVFALEKLFNKEATRIQCQVVGGIKDNKTRTATDWMEWQANALAPRIQMPLTCFRRKALEVLKAFKLQKSEADYIDLLGPAIDALAQFYGVSRCAAKIRMLDAGYKEAIGVFTYIDGHYVRPHQFKENAISEWQTYSVSVRDIVIERVVKPEFAALLENGDYIFVENHVCFNSPKYIEADEYGDLRLTEYARLHIDECCLVFDLEAQNLNEYGKTYYKECVLYRDADSKVEFVAHFSEANKGANESQKESIRAFKNDVLSLQRSLKEAFTESFDAVVKWSDMTEEELEEKADIDARTIQRLRNDPDQNPTIETMMPLCIAMKLPPTISRTLLAKAGIVFKATERDFMYQLLLDGCYIHPLEECNKMLVEQGIKPLGKSFRKELKDNNPELYKNLK